MIFKKIWAFLLKPSGWFCLLSALCTLLFSTAALVAVFTGNVTVWWTYPIYALAAASLFCFTFVCIYWVKHGRKKVRLLIGRYAFTERLYTDKGYRIRVLAILSFAFGLCYTAFLAVMAVIESSFWYASLAEYNIVFCLTRAYVLHTERKAAKLTPIAKDKRKIKAYAVCGGLIMLVGVQFVFSVMSIVFRNETFRYEGMMIYVFAAITFYRATLAIVRIIQLRKQNDYTLRSIVSYNLASAAVSIVSLQTAMFDSFHGEGINVPVFNAATGGTVCLFLLFLGGWVLVSGVKKYKQLENYHGKQ
ncbi:MAG: hypothetical protein E7367_02840 [Clostridiales bacterium]|nr:hypothetical protein [Clostridiales bacterium]